MMPQAMSVEKGWGHASLSILMMGLLLNQSSVLLGMNLSLADVFLVLLFFVWIFQKKLDIPVLPLLIFTSFSVLLLWNSVFVVPHVHHLPIDASSIAKDYLKLIVMFLYFLFGWHMVTATWMRSFLLSFLYGAAAIGAIGFLLTFSPHSGLSDLMLYANLRLKGFMNDPNYFSVIQCAAMVCAVRLLPRKSILKIVLLLILALSVLVSGSKTGMITMLGVSVYAGFHSFRLGEVNRSRFITNVVGVLVAVLAVAALFPFLNAVIQAAGSTLPSLERTALLFTDFKGATVSGGSGRDSVWDTAIHLTTSSPLLGVGVGNYGALAQRFSGDANVAHNTFLQLSAEWGIPITVCLILYLQSLIFKGPGKKQTRNTSYLLKELLFVFLISSMAISFNHSRVFWLFLGAAAHYFSAHFERNKEELVWQKRMDL